jgi:hypothetical protein
MGLLRSKKSFSLEIVTKPLVMASEISGLEPLRGKRPVLAVCTESR